MALSISDPGPQGVDVDPKALGEERIGLIGEVVAPTHEVFKDSVVPWMQQIHPTIFAAEAQAAEIGEYPSGPVGRLSLIVATPLEREELQHLQ